MQSGSLNFATILLLLLIAAAVWEVFEKTPWVAVAVRFTLKSNNRIVCSFSGRVLEAGEPMPTGAFVAGGSATELLEQAALEALDKKAAELVLLSRQSPVSRVELLQLVETQWKELVDAQR